VNHHIIILNLERSVDRRHLLEGQFKNIGLTNYTVFPCFDGKKIINMSFTASIVKGVGIGRKLEKNEISIIMSHIAALKHAQIMGYENTVILEDDVIICEDWEKRMELLSKLLPLDWEYVYLAGHSDFVKLPMYEEPTIIKAPKMIGAFAYMVNKSSIQKLITYCEEFVTTYDDMIMHKIQNNKLNGYLHIPYMAYHGDNVSTLWNMPSVNHPSIKYFKTKLA
jgi:GR25 family glycosyltransferase involved in LPS biosynthesis